MQAEDFFGRRLLTKEVYGNEHSYEKLNYVVVDAVTIKKKQLYCNRCSQTTPLQTARLNASTYYCPHCLFLGRCDTLQIRTTKWKEASYKSLLGRSINNTTTANFG